MPICWFNPGSTPIFGLSHQQQHGATSQQLLANPTEFHVMSGEVTRFMAKVLDGGLTHAVVSELGGLAQRPRCVRMGWFGVTMSMIE